ncbi:hypothetical protein [Rhodococcus sp. (in: high G+C Gram-positive bacteria)]|uniref:Uncharacterized protein n=1 Tax=Rhodococcus baikonurensis TaxID=172041 RepID=A0ABV5XFN2_9NOCA
MNTLNVASNGIPDARVTTAPSDIALSDAAERSSQIASSRSDSERIDHILITMRRALVQVEAIGPVDVELLELNSTVGLVIERVLANLMDMAFDINCHVSRECSGPTPETFSESCKGAVRCGLIDKELASELMPADGPHHVVMQLCLDTEPEQVEAVVARALSAFQKFECRAAEWAGRGNVSLTSL